MKKRRNDSSVEPWLAKPVIPVFWRHDEAEEKSLSDASLIFLQGGELAELSQMLDQLSRPALADIPVMLHIDLLAGLNSDDAGLRYLAGLKRINGIITVRSHMVAAARRLNLSSILLVFLQDGRSVERGLHVVEQCRPDIVELVPGAAALDVARSFEAVSVPVIAGGLIRTPELVRSLLSVGCRAVSSSDTKLWRLNRK